ncbi:MAG: polysaccharide biosynthesis/export family protein [bacterium]
MVRRSVLVCLCLSLPSLFAFGCAATNESVSQPPHEQGSFEAYVIGPEDVLEISVWQNQDLSRTVTVRPDGKISLPLVNDIQAAGLTPEELKARIRAGLKPYTEDPHVAVIVQQINSWRYYIQGEVRTPGVYPIRTHTTISQAVAMAGGFTEFAKKSKIQVYRKWKGFSEVIEVDFDEVLSDQAAERDIYLKPGDTIVVP